MAQTMLLMPPGVYTSSTHLKREPLALQIQKIKPKSSTHLLFSPLSPSSNYSTDYSVVQIRALFKSKTKAPPKKAVKEPKPKVEDGIFGTSGGIGFTKENELFVGRVAMLGFADKDKDNEAAAEIEAEQPQVGIEQEQVLKHKHHHLIPFVAAMIIALSPLCLSPASSLAAGQSHDVAVDIQRRGSSLFHQSCIGCHDGGGNIIQPGATLFARDLQRNGFDTEEDIYEITYYGKGRMPGFGEKCTPRGQCTFGPRLQDEEIQILSRFVKLQADQGWRMAQD